MCRRSPIFLLLAVLISLPLALAAAPAAAEEVQAGMGGGGPLSASVFLDLEGLNEILEANGYAPLNEPVSLMGGGGFGGLVEDLRFGGLGFGGEVSSALSQKVANLSFSFGGFLVERGLVAAKRYSLSIGAVIGGGDAELTLVDHQSSSFEDAVSNPPNTSLTRGFFGIQTYVGMDLSLLDWIMLKVNLGYLWTLGDPWKQDGRPLPGPPESLNAPVLQVMIAFGGREELGEEEGESEGKAETIERGSFVVEQQGMELGQEDFILEREPDDIVRLISQVALTSQGQQIKMDLELRLTADLEPLSYVGQASTPEGQQRFGAEIEGNQARLYAQVGGQTQEETITSDQRFVFFDNNQGGQLLVLYELVKGLAKGEEAQFAALVPQVLASFPLRVKRAGPITIEADGEELEGEKFSLNFVGGVFVEIFVYRDSVIGYQVPSQEVFLYRSDLFPGGFQVSTLEPTGAQLPQGVEEIELTFPSDGLNLAGTLTLPKQVTGPVPAVLFIHGSGPVDRNENMPGLKIDFFNTVAHRLAQTGIGSFRYDKRGVGESEGDFSRAGMTDLVSDAHAALRFLKDQEEVDPDQVFLLGHSEGGNIVPLLATDDSLVQGLILVATNAHPLDQVIRWQVETLNRAAGLSESELERALKQQDEWAALVRESEGDWGNYPFERVKARLEWLTREKYAELKRTSLRWLREHFTRDPLETIRQVKAPVLIIQGEKDLQVPQGEAELLAQALREAGNEDVEVHIFPDLNHLMRHHPEEPNLQYRHLDEPVDERVLQIISSWIQDQIQKE